MEDTAETIPIQLKAISLKAWRSWNMEQTREKEVCYHQNQQTTHEAQVEEKSSCCGKKKILKKGPKNIKASVWVDSILLWMKVYL